MGVSGESEGCAAARMWHIACQALAAPAPDDAWQQVVDTSPPDAVWHSLRNCVAYQAGVWQNLLAKGVQDVVQPAAFKLAVVLRHTPAEVTARLLADLLHSHPQSQDMTAYVLSLLTDDEAARGSSVGGCAACGAGCAACGGGCARARRELPLRDLQLFGDCELAVLAASREEYDAHAKLVRAEYSKLTHHSYVELRIKIPKLFHTPEFECFEAAARENIEREICTLREHLLTGRAD